MSKKIEVKEINQMYVLAVASSAGGLEALTNLFAHLPEKENVNLVIVVAQHLSPTHKSHMVALLSKASRWPINEAAHNTKLATGNIYITPPDRDIIIKKGRILLSKPSSSIGPKPSADLLFSSIAENYKEQAISLVLSGTGRDGSIGIIDINKHGGFILVQKPQTAAYDGMPKAALEAKLPTKIISTPEIGEILELICSGKGEYLKVSEKRPNSELPDLDKIFDLLQKKSGVDFSHYKFSTIQRRLESRLNIVRKGNLTEYVSYIESNPSEINELFNHVLIGVTNFFRDPFAFEELEKNLRELISAKNEKNLRIWHPGCASGEEAYSISILLHEILGKDIVEWNIQIFATDIDDDAIARARRGRFAITAIELMDSTLVKKHFIQHNDFVEVNKKLRSIILFSRHDLTSNPPFLKLDLISCRNLLIYFDAELQKRIIPIFHYALEENALLFLGKSETLGVHSDLFDTVSKTHKIWRRKSGTSSASPNFAPTQINSSLKLRKNRVSFDNKTIPERVEETLFSSFVHPYAVINDSYEIQYVSGNVKSFLQFNPGAMSSNILKQCKKEIELSLSQTIQRAIKTLETANSAPRQLKNEDNFKLFRFVVHPMLHFKETHFLVIFESIEVDYQLISAEKVTNQDFENIRISELELELDSTREHLQSYIEELETSNEEMQALNEEMQSTNEELQSVNEELETTNEELQSTNEEMQIAYQELRDIHELIKLKEREMEKANKELESILDNDLQGFILCTEHFEILHFNRYAKKVLDEISSQKLNKLNGLLSFLPKDWVGEFIDLVKQSLKNGQNAQKQLSIKLNQGYVRHFLVSSNPIKVEKSEKAYLTINLIEKTEEISLNQHLDQINTLLDQVSDVVKIGGWELNIETHQTTWTKGVYDIHKVDESFHTNLNNGLKFYNDQDQQELNTLINRTIRTGKGFSSIFKFTDAEKIEKIVEVKGFPRFQDSKMISIWGTIQDITNYAEQEKKHARLNLELLRSNKELEDFAYVASHDLQEPLRMIYSFIEILEERYQKAFDEEGQQYLGFITDGARRMQAMLSDLLSYSRVNTNDEAFDTIDLNQLVKDVLINFEDIIASKNAIINIDKLESIKGNTSLISRLFQNLISNSLKYCTRVPNISIWSTIDNNKIFIYLKDNGIGIENSQFEHVFGIFKRLHTAQEYPGSGIGLAICKRIVMKHHGNISIESSTSEGSVFQIELPFNG